MKRFLFIILSLFTIVIGNTEIHASPNTVALSTKKNDALISTLKQSIADGVSRLVGSQLKNKLECVVKGGAVTIIITAPTVEEALHTFSKCAVGIDLTPEEWKALYGKAKDYIEKNWDDPYLHGQATVFVATILIPYTKLSKLSKVKLFAKLRGNSKFVGKVDELEKLGKVADDGGDVGKVVDELAEAKHADEITTLARGGEDFTVLANARRLPGTATGNGKAITGTWLRGTERNAGLFPKSVADKLKGKQFKNFDEFREAFWREVANDLNLASQFDPPSIQRMQNGFAPFTDISQQLGSQKNFILHHKTPINQGGAVYDIDNLYVVTPKYHKEILNPAYHYGYGY
jgi:hypothetical protein